MTVPDLDLLYVSRPSCLECVLLLIHRNVKVSGILPQRGICRSSLQRQSSRLVRKLLDVEARAILIPWPEELLSSSTADMPW
jgi:hypothetical protein